MRSLISRYCYECTHRTTADKTSDEYRQWYDGHKDQCAINHTGSGPIHGIYRSTEDLAEICAKLGLRYTTVIGDGDSKSLAVLHENKPYGNTPIIKHKCVGHIQ